MIQVSSVSGEHKAGRSEDLVKRVFCQIKLWNRNRKTRRQLQQLPARLLNDIGVTRHQAETEAAKSFWQ